MSRWEHLERSIDEAEAEVVHLRVTLARIVRLGGPAGLIAQTGLDIADDGKLTGSAVLKQSEWGIKQYSILFGSIKVADEVEVTIAADLKATQSR